MLELRDRTRLALVAVLTPPVAVMAIITVVATATGGIAGDFRGAFLPAAEAIVDGGSPMRWRATCTRRSWRSS